MFRNTNVAHDHPRRPPLRAAGLRMALAVPVCLPLLFTVVTVQSVGLSPATVQSGSSSTGTVTLSATSATTVKVALFSSKPSLATVPEIITMGKKTRTQTFPITTVSGQAGCATISAQVVGTGPRPPAQLFVQPTDPPGPIVLTLSGNTVVAGGQSLSGLVTAFLQPGAPAAVVQLTSSNPQVTVPASVTLHGTEGGPLQAGFTLSAAVSAAPTCAIITATFQGSRSRALVKVAIISG